MTGHLLALARVPVAVVDASQTARAEDATGSSTREELLARVSLVHHRGLRLASLRRLAAIAVPVWIQAHTRVLPDLLAWLVALLFGFFLAETVLYAVLEHVWARRGERLRDGGSRAVIHELWTVRDQLRSALWYGVGIVSLLPWAVVALGHALPPPLYPLTWLALALAALAVTSGPSRR